MLGEILGDPGFLVPYALLQAAIFLVLIRLLDLYEREPVAALAFMAVWGGVVAPALTLALREPLLQMLPDTDTPLGAAITGAFIEEPVKGLALVMAFGLSYYFARRFGTLEFEGITDGVVYGAAIGLGFAFTEDVFFLVRQPSTAEGLDVFLQRADFLGLSMLGHAVFSGTFGAGLGAATWARGWIRRTTYPLLGIAAALAMHFTHNYLSVSGFGMATRAVDYLFVVGFVSAMLAWLSHQRDVIRDQLMEEQKNGLVTENLVEEIVGHWKRFRKRLGLIRRGQDEELRIASGLQEELVELAFAKWRLRKHGIKGAWEPLEVRRRRIRNLVEGLAVRERT